MKNHARANKDYNAIFQQLINNAIKDGWHPMWADRIEGNDREIGCGDIASEWFYFLSPEDKEEE